MSETSIVIPVRDGERYIGEAIESLLAQTAPPMEIIVVDDGSSDRSAEIVTGYAGVRLVQIERRGPGAARNVGVACASSPLLGFLDADDIATERRLELQVELLERRPEVHGVVGRMQMFISEDCDPAVRERALPVAGTPVAYLASTLLMRRDAFLATGGLNDGLTNAEMIDWFARARRELAFAEVDAVVLRRRIHGANNSLRRDQMHRELMRVARSAVLRARDA